MLQGAFPARLGLGMLMFNVRNSSIGWLTVIVIRPPGIFKIALKMASPLLHSGSQLLERIVLLDELDSLWKYVNPEVQALHIIC